MYERESGDPDDRIPPGMICVCTLYTPNLPLIFFNYYYKKNKLIINPNTGVFNERDLPLIPQSLFLFPALPLLTEVCSSTIQDENI